ncbi:dihydrofolate reductase family protein [Actinoplanes sp. TRM 88003]|uniref:Dihydrofolate reductase family protein n=1 Tax=Paractinoplanes aksuensis TaxID=2939490 RepID=A0ABT1E0U4_9ACTN|nr:dihydrofolate reductase family protein [Actinoplanes aksuensis]MCO8276774.1 dihydrofolate reductase family protein [Actinoplanes aksuensis]
MQLYGRHTWEHFARLWPTRDTDYAKLMNAVPKRIATRTTVDPSAWSAVIEGDPLAWAADERTRRDVVVIGSLTLVRALAEAGLIDEYRLITFPTVAGEGDRLPLTGDFHFTTVEPADRTTFTVLRRRTGSPGTEEGKAS